MTEAEVRALMESAKAIRWLDGKEKESVISVCKDWLRSHKLSPDKPNCAGFWWLKTPVDSRPCVIEVFGVGDELATSHPASCVRAVKSLPASWLFAGPIPGPQEH
jgi:hypothetical protein